MPGLRQKTLDLERFRPLSILRRSYCCCHHWNVTTSRNLYTRLGKYGWPERTAVAVLGEWASPTRARYQNTALKYHRFGGIQIGVQV